MPKGRIVIPITKNDKPISIDPKREAELVEMGVAKYVDDPEEKNLESMSVKELKALADEMGIEYPDKVRRVALIDLIENAEEITEESGEAAPEINPEEAVQ